MFSIDRNEYVLENVARTIKYECFRRGFDYSEDEIKFLAFQEIGNPLGEFTGTYSNLEPELNRLMDICIDFLCDHEATYSIKAIIVQNYFLQWYKDRDSVTEKYRELIRTHTNPLIVDICRSEPQDTQQYQNLYRKIVLAMLILSGVGDATYKDDIVTAEVALKSIFPVKNLEGFVHLSYQNKLKELDDMKKTITGIILYNGYKFDRANVTSKQQSILLDEGSKVVVEKLSTYISCLDTVASALMFAVHEFVQFDEIDTKLLVINPSPMIDTNQIHVLKTYLLLVQQCRLFIRFLLEDARYSQQDFFKQEDDYQFNFKSLLNDLRGKIAISMNKVYTKFQDVGAIWTREQELCVIFNTINDTQNAIMSLSEVHRMPDIIKKLTGYEGLEPVDIEELASHIPTRIDPGYFYQTKIDPLQMHQGEVTEFSEEFPVTLEYNGFCPVYFLESGGFLLDARKDIGIFQYEGKSYGFREAQAAYVFGNDPKKYIEKVIEFVRFNVEYIEMLGLTEEIMKHRGLKIKREGVFVKPVKPMRDKEMQTVVHPIEYAIDKDYSWNIWDYKRKAVQLATITQCATRSTQSKWSHFRESALAQTYSPREKKTQTMRDSVMLTDQLPTETWCIRGKHPHARVTTADCTPGPKRSHDNEHCNP